MLVMLARTFDRDLLDWLWNIALLIGHFSPYPELLCFVIFGRPSLAGMLEAAAEKRAGIRRIYTFSYNTYT